MTIQEMLGDAYKDGMTAEDILKLDFEDGTTALKTELQKAKNSVSKANSEAAEYKRKLQEKMTEDELAKQQRDEELQQLKDSYNELKKQAELSSYEAKYKSLGYDDTSSKEAAQAVVDGDLEKVFKLQKEFNATLEKNIKADLLKQTPTPTGGSTTPTTITPEQFAKMGLSERTELFEKDPETYNKLKDGG